MCFPVYELIQNSFVYNNLVFCGGCFKFISQSISCYCEHFKQGLKQGNKGSQRFSCYTEFSQTNICTV